MENQQLVSKSKAQAPSSPKQDNTVEAMNLTELKNQPITKINEIAQEMGIENAQRMRHQDLIFAILKGHARSGEDIYGDGVL